MLNISIKDFKKVIKTDKDLLKFLTTYQIVEEKLDGVKVYLYLKPNATDLNDYKDNWIVAYKGNIIYPEEFEDIDLNNAKQSIGQSQYAFIWEHLKYINVNNLPKGTIFFCEYLIKKPTLMSNYKHLYELILLSYSKSKCKEKNGMLICDNEDFNYDREERKQLANKLKISYPPEIFKGVLYPTDELLKGKKSLNFNKSLQSNINELKNIENNIKLYWKILNNIFLNTRSQFGGEPEGFVFWNNLFEPVKIQQEYQLSREERAKIKARYREENIIKEEIYWIKVKQIAEDIILKLNITGNQDFRKYMKTAVKLIKDYKLPKHSKKTEQTIKDDILLTIKLKLIRLFAEKWALVQGKFRVFTNGHKKMIDTALQKYKKVIINIVSNKETKGTIEIRKAMLETCYKNEIKQGRIKIINSRTGNLKTIINKVLPDIVGVVLTGSDRVEAYKKLLANFDDIHIHEIKRDENDISATKIINNINDYSFFKKNAPKCIYNFYSKLKKIYNL